MPVLLALGDTEVAEREGDENHLGSALPGDYAQGIITLIKLPLHLGKINQRIHVDVCGTQTFTQCGCSVSVYVSGWYH